MCSRLVSFAIVSWASHVKTRATRTMRQMPAEVVMDDADVYEIVVDDLEAYEADVSEEEEYETDKAVGMKRKRL